MQVYYTIYKTTNLCTNEYYIGKHKTKNPYDKYLGSGSLLLEQIEKYGRDAFKKEVLFIFDNEDEMNKKEEELVDIHDPLSLNLMPGGKGGFGFINENGLRNEIQDMVKQNPEEAKEWQKKGAHAGGQAFKEKTEKMRLTEMGYYDKMTSINDFWI